MTHAAAATVALALASGEAARAEVVRRTPAAASSVHAWRNCTGSNSSNTRSKGMDNSSSNSRGEPEQVSHRTKAVAWDVSTPNKD